MKNLLLFVLILGLIGCSTAKKASRDIAKYHQRYPAVTADFCHKNYPLKISSDTTETITFNEVEMIVGEEDVIQPDDQITTTQNPKTNPKTVRVDVPTRVITITNNVKDSAEVKKLQLECKESEEASKKAHKKELNEANKKIADLEKSKIKLEKGKSTYKGVTIGLGTILTLLIGLIFLLLKRKTKP